MSQFKKKLTAFSAMLAFLSLSSAAIALPGDVMGQTGNTNISTSGNRMDVDINSYKNGDVGQIDWRTFNVGSNEHVNFGFSGLSQTIINRVLGGQESSILGKLTNSCIGGGSCTSFAETSKVILINPAGIMFGQGSMVDLNSFTASTHDIVGAKNIKGMTDAELENYQSGVLNKLSPWSSVNGEGRNYAAIKFDSNYTEAFEKAGIKYTPGATAINMDGATFAHFDANGNILGNDTNKTLAFVSDNINYKDSLIRTGSNNNYVSGSNAQSFSNVRFITADGVTFNYLINGYSNGYNIAEDTKDVARNINIDNSGLAADKVGIQAGNIAIENKSNAAGSNIKISNAVIKGTKLVNTEDGNIKIVGSGDITIDKARLQTSNTVATRNDVEQNTISQQGGEIIVSAGKNLDVKDSFIITAESKGETANNAGAGSLKLYSGKNATIDDTEIIAKGNTDILASEKVSINDTLIQATNTGDTAYTKDITVAAAQEVKVHNSILDASKDIYLRSADANNATSGNIIISSDLDADGKNQTLLIANNKLSVQGANTKVDDATLAYHEIKFYNDGVSGTNNVTIANNSTFAPFDVSDTGKKSMQADITLETNGNFTLDNATLQKTGYKLSFVNDADGNLVDNGKAVDPISYTMTIKDGSNATNVNITSTQGDIITKNGTNVGAKNNINLTANAGNITSQDTTLTADNDVNITAAKDAKLWGNVSLTAGNNVNVNAQNIYNGDTQYNRETTIKAGKDVNIKAKETLVNMSTTEAGQDINLEGKTVKSVKKDKLTADRNINVTSSEETYLANSQLDAKNDINVTAGTNANIGADLKAGNDVNIKAQKNVNIQKTALVVGPVEPSITAGNNINVEATKGKLTISDISNIVADKDVSLKAYETITFGAQGAPDVNIDNSNTIIAGEDMYITSTNANINGEKTTMPTLQYGDRLTFNAKGDNTFTSEDSLKSVNVDYIAGGANKFYTNDDIQFVNSSLKAPTNFIESGSDVILNDLTIKQATTNAKDTVTEIYANGDVTTNDVTGTAAADASASIKKFPQSVSTSRTGDGKTTLDINKTKLKITTETVKDASNPDNGSIILDVKNADNQNAGLELVAQNVDKLDKDPTGGNFKTGYYKSGTAKWDENIDKGEGPEVHLNATDDKLAITKIDTDKLTLSKSDTILAGKDTADGKNPTITVKDQGGFNMDTDVDYDSPTDGFKYDTSKDESQTTETVRIWDEEKGEYVISESDNKTVYGKDYVDRETTTTIKREHEIHFGDNGDQQFNLIYEQIDTDVKETPGTVTRVVEECPELPEVDDRVEGVDSYINQIKLPREQVEISKTSKVSDNTVDQTSNIMSAAAKVDLGQEASATYSSTDKEDEKSE